MAAFQYPEFYKAQRCSYQATTSRASLLARRSTVITSPWILGGSLPDFGQRLHRVGTSHIRARMLAKSVAVILLTLSPGLATAAPFSVSFVFDRLEAPGFVGENFDSGGAGGIASIADTYISASAQMTSAAQAIATSGTLGVQSFADFAISGTPLTRAYALAIALLFQSPRRRPGAHPAW
jgi:hypothetical protein